MKTKKQMCEATARTHNAIDKRIKRLNIQPVMTKGRQQFFSDEDFEKIISYIPEIQVCNRTREKKPPKQQDERIKNFSRVSTGH